MFAVKCIKCGSINKPIPKEYEEIYLYDDKKIDVGLYKCSHCDFKWKRVISPFVRLIGDESSIDNEIIKE